MADRSTSIAVAAAELQKKRAKDAEEKAKLDQELAEQQPGAPVPSSRPQIPPKPSLPASLGAMSGSPGPSVAPAASPAPGPVSPASSASGPASPGTSPALPASPVPGPASLHLSPPPRPPKPSAAKPRSASDALPPLSSPPSAAPSAAPRSAASGASSSAVLRATESAASAMGIVAEGAAVVLGVSPLFFLTHKAEPPKPKERAASVGSPASGSPASGRSLAPKDVKPDPTSAPGSQPAVPAMDLSALRMDDYDPKKFEETFRINEAAREAARKASGMSDGKETKELKEARDRKINAEVQYADLKLVDEAHLLQILNQIELDERTLVAIKKQILEARDSKEKGSFEKFQALINENLIALDIPFLNNLMFDAVKRNKQEEIRFLTSKGVSIGINLIDIRDDLYNTPLIIACNPGKEIAEKDSIATITLLRDLKANFLLENELSLNPYLTAVKFGHKNIAKLIASFNKDYTKPSALGKTEFVATCEGGDEKSIKEMIEGGRVNEDQWNKACDNAVMAAARSGSVPVFNLVANKKPEFMRLKFVGIDQKIVGTGYTLLMAACEGGNVAIIEFLIQKAKFDVFETCRDGWTVLMSAIKGKGGKPAIRALLGDPKNPTNKKLLTMFSTGHTPLTVACRYGKPDIAELLLEYDNSLLTQDTEQGFTPYQVACRFGHLSTMQYIKNRDPSHALRKNKKGYTALIAAMYDGGIEVTRTILKEQPMAINALNTEGASALVFAAIYNQFFLYRELLKHGAKIQVKSKYGKDDLEHAANSIPMRAFIREVHSMAAFVRIGDLTTIKSYMASGAGHTLYFRLNNGNSLLHEAVLADQGDAAEFLIKQGVQPSWKNDDGDTASDLALKNKKYEIAVQLVEQGKLKELQDLFNKETLKNLRTEEAGNSLFHVAIGCGKLEIARFLWDIGFKDCKDLVNNHGKTPFDLVIGEVKFNIIFEFFKWRKLTLTTLPDKMIRDLKLQELSAEFQGYVLKAQEKGIDLDIKKISTEFNNPEFVPLWAKQVYDNKLPGNAKPTQEDYLKLFELIFNGNIRVIEEKGENVSFRLSNQILDLDEKQTQEKSMVSVVSKGDTKSAREPAEIKSGKDKKVDHDSEMEPGSLIHNETPNEKYKRFKYALLVLKKGELWDAAWKVVLSSINNQNSKIQDSKLVKLPFRKTDEGTQILWHLLNAYLSANIVDFQRDKGTLKPKIESAKMDTLDSRKAILLAQEIFSYGVAHWKPAKGQNIYESLEEIANFRFSMMMPEVQSLIVDGHQLSNANKKKLWESINFELERFIIEAENQGYEVDFAYLAQTLDKKYWKIFAKKTVILADEAGEQDTPKLTLQEQNQVKLLENLIYQGIIQWRDFDDFFKGNREKKRTKYKPQEPLMPTFPKEVQQQVERFMLIFQTSAMANDFEFAAQIITKLLTNQNDDAIKGISFIRNKKQGSLNDFYIDLITEVCFRVSFGIPFDMKKVVASSSADPNVSPDPITPLYSSAQAGSKPKPDEPSRGSVDQTQTSVKFV